MINVNITMNIEYYHKLIISVEILFSDLSEDMLNEIMKIMFNVDIKIWYQKIIFNVDIKKPTWQYRW